MAARSLITHGLKRENFMDTNLGCYGMVRFCYGGRKRRQLLFKNGLQIHLWNRVAEFG